jgi:ATP-dependent Lon protease
MEVIEMSSYLETEKLHIARRFLVPRQMEEHGVKAERLRITDDALSGIVRKYTMEAGVRNLEREIAAICRKAAVRFVDDEKAEITVDNGDLDAFLGVRKIPRDAMDEKPQVGVCVGMSCNYCGGSMLFVETSIMGGVGQVVTTGHLGDVMKESARAALSYVRSRAERFGLDSRFYRKVDIHVHVPDGATPKDGPSAGITIATSVTSALLGIPVRNDVAMTGEISLRGRVLPIGGLREKLVAAARMGIKHVLVPKDNEKDLQEVPEEVRSTLDIILVESMDEVLPNALAATSEEIFSGRDLAKSVSASLVLRSGKTPRCQPKAEGGNRSHRPCARPRSHPNRPRRPAGLPKGSSVGMPRHRPRAGAVR